MAMRWNGKRMDFWEIVNTKKTNAWGEHWYTALNYGCNSLWLEAQGPVVRSAGCAPTWWLGWCWLCNVLTDTRAQSILPAPAQALLCLHHTSNTPTRHRQWLPFQPAGHICHHIVSCDTMDHELFQLYILNDIQIFLAAFKCFWWHNPHLVRF